MDTSVCEFPFNLTVQFLISGFRDEVDENCTLEFRVNNQLDTLFLMCLFHFSTCFEQHSAHHQENQLYQYIIWYISLSVGARLVCRSGRNSLTCIPDGHHQLMY